MVGRKCGDIPESLVRGRDRFEEWRRARTLGDRIPDPLWMLAVKLADAHGISRTACVLKLDYYSLKKRVAAKPPCSASVHDSVSMPEAFIEVSGPSSVAASSSASGTLAVSESLASSGECVVEFEDGSGASLRVHLRGCDVPDLVALGRSFWSGD
jgi:hypothetical protein